MWMIKHKRIAAFRRGYPLFIFLSIWDYTKRQKNIRITYANRISTYRARVEKMVKNNIELDIKVKCVEEHMTQADIAKKVETPASYVNKLIRREEGVVNNTYVKMLEALGYDIELHYVKREE